MSFKLGLVKEIEFLKSEFKQMAKVVKDVAKPLKEKMVRGLRDIGKYAKTGVLNQLGLDLSSTMGIVTQLIIKLDPLKLVTQAIGEILDLLGGILQQGFMPAVEALWDIFTSDAVMNAFTMISDLISAILEALSPLFDIIGSVIDIIMTLVMAALQPLFTVIEALAPIFEMFPILLQPLFDILMSLTPIFSLFGELLASLSPLLELFLIPLELFAMILEILQPLIDFVINLIAFAIDMVKKRIERIMPIFQKLIGFIRKVVDVIKEKLAPIFEFLVRVFKAVANGFIKFVNWIIGIINKLIPGTKWDIRKIPLLETGAIVKTAGIAYLHPNEIVVNPARNQQVINQPPVTNNTYNLYGTNQDLIQQIKDLTYHQEVTRMMTKSGY
jgi:phage-related protein